MRISHGIWAPIHPTHQHAAPACLSFFQSSSDDNYDIDDDIDDDSDIDSESSNTTFYSKTESEYNFDETDKKLKENLDNVMKRVNVTLKKKDNLGQIRINKKREYL